MIHLSIGSTFCLIFCCPSHSVQRTSVFEPRYLALVEGVIQFRLPHLTILGMHSKGQWLANRQLGAHDVYLVLRVNLVIVGGVSKSERQEALLLEISLML